MNVRAFKILKDRELHGTLHAKAGDTVFDYMGCDYGLSSDDSRWTGVQHTSVTNNPDGSAPSFTVPVSDLEPIVGPSS